MGKILLIPSPFYRCGNWGSEAENSPFKVAQLKSGRRTQYVQVLRPEAHGLSHSHHEQYSHQLEDISNSAYHLLSAYYKPGTVLNASRVFLLTTAQTTLAILTHLRFPATCEVGTVIMSFYIYAQGRRASKWHSQDLNPGSRFDLVLELVIWNIKLPNKHSGRNDTF